MTKQKENKGLFFGVLAIIGLSWIVTGNKKDSADSLTGQPGNLPRGLRNNNIGNIKMNSANNWLGKIPAENNTDGTFEQFSAKKYGTRALLKLLKKYFLDYDLKTINQILSKWAPGSQQPGSYYVDFVSNGMQIYKDDLLQLQDLKKLAVLIAYFENGQPATNLQEVNQVVSEFNLQI